MLLPGMGALARALVTMCIRVRAPARLRANTGAPLLLLGMGALARVRTRAPVTVCASECAPLDLCVFVWKYRSCKSLLVKHLQAWQGPHARAICACPALRLHASAQAFSVPWMRG